MRQGVVLEGQSEDGRRRPGRELHRFTRGNEREVSAGKLVNAPGARVVLMVGGEEGGDDAIESSV